MNLFDRVHYAFNSVMSIRTEMMEYKDKIEEKIAEISQELQALAEVVQEIQDKISPEDDVQKFIDDEALEIDPDDIEDKGEQDPEVVFVGETWGSKKRKLN